MSNPGFGQTFCQYRLDHINVRFIKFYQGVLPIPGLPSGDTQLRPFNLKTLGPGLVRGILCKFAETILDKSFWTLVIQGDMARHGSYPIRNLMTHKLGSIKLPKLDIENNLPSDDLCFHLQTSPESNGKNICFAHWHVTLWSLIPTPVAFFGGGDSQLCQTLKMQTIFLRI